MNNTFSMFLKKSVLTSNRQNSELKGTSFIIYPYTSNFAESCSMKTYFFIKLVFLSKSISLVGFFTFKEFGHLRWVKGIHNE